ncbi:MAG: hypothetical protein ACXQS2_06600 [Methermicoccaceae archaeon]
MGRKEVDKIVIRDNTGEVRIVSDEELDRLSKSIEYTVLDVVFKGEPIELTLKKYT